MSMLGAALGGLSGGGGMSASSSASSSGTQKANTGVQVNQPINFGSISSSGYGQSAVTAFVNPFGGSGWSSPTASGLSSASGSTASTSNASGSAMTYLVIGVIAIAAIAFIITYKG